MTHPHSPGTIGALPDHRVAYGCPPPGYPPPHTAYPQGGYPPHGYFPAPAGYAAPQQYPTRPAAPGDVRRFRMTLRRHTGLMVLFLNQRYSFTGTLEECEQAYRLAQTHNLLGGWWSVASLVVWNWVCLLGNHNQIQQVRRLRAGPAPSGPIGP